MVVEFGLIGGLAILLIAAALQIGLYFYVSASLENATARAMRQVMTGMVGAGSMTGPQFQSTVLCPLLPTAMSCSNVVVNLQTVSEGAAPNGFYQFVNSNASWIVPPTMNNAQTTFCTGTGGSIIYAQIYYAMPIVVPFLLNAIGTAWNGQNVYFVGAFAAFRNEPFQSTGGPC